MTWKDPKKEGLKDLNVQLENLVDILSKAFLKHIKKDLIGTV